MLPKEFCERMEAMLGKEYQEFLAAYDEPRVRTLRVNKKKAGEEFAARCGFRLRSVPWAANGYYYEPGDDPGRHVYHEAGVYYIQEASAMAPAAFLDAQPGERILDLCAAPGGKSTMIADAMEGKGLLVCNEIHPTRVKILAENLERLGVTNAVVTNESPADLARRFPEGFDKILVDAPCSGEGMFRKQPESVKEWSAEQVALCARRQDGIMEAAYAMLRLGGRLVYSTCTFAPEENEGTISRFCFAHEDMTLLETAPYPGMMPGRPDWYAQFCLPSDKAAKIPPAAGLEKAVRFFPHRMRAEGHFAAVLQKAQRDPAPVKERERTKMRRGRRGEGRRYRDFPELREFAAGLLAPEEEKALSQGTFALFGSRLYLLPDGAPELDGLKVRRAGLCLGELRKRRFEPAHAWAMALRAEAVRRRCELSSEGEEAYRYLRGETLEARPETMQGKGDGFCLVTVDGYPIGWGKRTGGTVKNHYPKGLRKDLMPR